MPRVSKEPPPFMGGKYSQVGGRSTSAGGLWSVETCSAVGRAIEAVTEGGDGITFARTRDGGALCVAVLSDGAVHKWYASNAAGLLELLEELVEASTAQG